MVLWVIILMYVLGGLLVLLVSREIVCWYFKINKLVSLLESINIKMSSSTQVYDNNIDTSEIDEKVIEKVSPGLAFQNSKKDDNHVSESSDSPKGNLSILKQSREELIESLKCIICKYYKPNNALWCGSPTEPYIEKLIGGTLFCNAFEKEEDEEGDEIRK
ncbi:hypothetical protein ACFLXY_09325 [Chloroflexota bacterium]